MKQVEEIAKEKLEDLNAYDVDQASKIILGSARSMGMEICLLYTSDAADE